MHMYILLILCLLNNINQHHPPVSIQQNIPILTELPMVKPSNIPGNGSKAAPIGRRLQLTLSSERLC